MPAYFDDTLFDNGLSAVDVSMDLHVTSDLAPADRAAVISQSLASVAVDAADVTIADSSPDGRGATVAAQSGVSVSTSGTPTHYCLVDASKILAYTEVHPDSPDLTSGSTFNIPAGEFSIGDPGVV